MVFTHHVNAHKHDANPQNVQDSTADVLKLGGVGGNVGRASCGVEHVGRVGVVLFEVFEVAMRWRRQSGGDGGKEGGRGQGQGMPRNIGRQTNKGYHEKSQTKSKPTMQHIFVVLGGTVAGHLFWNILGRHAPRVKLLLFRTSTVGKNSIITFLSQRREEKGHVLH